jgi:hypothetical protein
MQKYRWKCYKSASLLKYMYRYSSNKWENYLETTNQVFLFDSKIHSKLYNRKELKNKKNKQKKPLNIWILIQIRNNSLSFPEIHICQFKWCPRYSLNHSFYINHIGGVMVSDLASSALDRGCDTQSGQTKDYKIGISFVAFPLSTQH